MKKYLYTIFFFSLLSCKTTKPVDYSNELIEKNLPVVSKQKTIHDSTFVNISDFNNDFVLDLKYATNDNFLKAQVYDCAKCLLRYKTMKMLILAQEDFKKLGYKIKLFDCYRPHDVQKAMWKILPDANYVADPAKGSLHNRGGAIDLTLIDKNGNEIDMGTPFDDFTEASSHDYQNLSIKVLENRKLLKTIMEKHGLMAIKSEWWHYNKIVEPMDKISNFKWKCN
ncbi:MAG: D-alanyl-D-alanine dipeptidase [Flavobacterium sp.]|jgi:D-alanyl-D-alanine dipeptidase